MNQTGGFFLGSAPSVSQEQEAHLLTQPGTDGQKLLYQCPVNLIPKAPPATVLAPPPTRSTPRKRTRQSHQDDGRPYIKKPPNAFMLYLEEQRPKVVAELNMSGSAAVNAVVGARWKLLSKDEQAKYFDRAETERWRHTKEHPQWSTKDNYGKKRKRVRNRSCTTVSASDQEDQQVKKAYIAPAQQPQTQPGVTSLPHQQAVCLQLPNQVLSSSHVDVPTDLCAGPKLSNTSPAFPVDSTPSTSFASQARLFQPRTEPILFTDTDMCSVLDHLPIMAQGDLISPQSDASTGPQLNQKSATPTQTTATSQSYADLTTVDVSQIGS
ncbi:ataxin-7 [Sarotherodon galilaeus]